jgi:hypothetical protein
LLLSLIFAFVAISILVIIARLIYKLYGYLAILQKSGNKAKTCIAFFARSRVSWVFRVDVVAGTLSNSGYLAFSAKLKIFDQGF